VLRRFYRCDTRMQYGGLMLEVEDERKWRFQGACCRCQRPPGSLPSSHRTGVPHGTEYSPSSGFRHEANQRRRTAHVETSEPGECFAPILRGLHPPNTARPFIVTTEGLMRSVPVQQTAQSDSRRVSGTAVSVSPAAGPAASTPWTVSRRSGACPLVDVRSRPNTGRTATSGVTGRGPERANAVSLSLCTV